MSQQAALRVNGQSATYRCAKFLDLVEAAAWAAAAKPVISPREYRTVAGEFLAALELLADQPGMASSAWVCLAAQALECTLKAYITRLGLPAPARRQDHDLINLWSSAVNASAAAAKKISLEARPPEWCVMLNALHDHPFPHRYPAAEGLTATTERAQLARTLRALLAEVEAAFG
jgi:hypothetical protein